MKTADTKMAWGMEERIFAIRIHHKDAMKYMTSTYRLAYSSLILGG